ncbi:hypothetical protein GCM10010168_41850 [Actinoplanes ianthinogenes]|uniref:Uncharacterized protein n=1 Tax=Actinoplanes ianthinogenes TaxID=122358 RepID=A0ABN6CD14_9ACTN|nr:hypothetical protein [Actinoplanes ianthinogenes]BCJ43505.1 hypothetical protein Aiant_41620 [Actinoplanes ianthinogenes]GGR19642.1 hypothetical protein GCM10010168_41850 [Actinoplanes ianthinogenes]
MFATMRRKRRSARMRNELGQGVDHFKRAASLAAQETSATVGPRLNAAVERVQPAAGKAKDAASQSWDSALAALTPLVTAATDNVRQAGKTSKKVSKRELKAQRKRAEKLQRKADKAVGKKRGRGSKLAGYALLGTAVGIGAAWYAKRRSEAQWEEYDAAPNPSPAGADDAAFEPLEPTVYTTANGTSTEQAGKPNPAK